MQNQIVKFGEAVGRKMPDLTLAGEMAEWFKAPRLENVKRGFGPAKGDSARRNPDESPGFFVSGIGWVAEAVFGLAAYFPVPASLERWPIE